MPLTLQPLQPETIPAFAQQVLQLYADDPGPVPMTPARAAAQATQLLAHPALVRPFLLVAEEPEGGTEGGPKGGAVVGHLILSLFFSNEFGGVMAYIDELSISPDRRSQGLGTAAIQAVLTRAATEGWVRIALEVNDDNPRARALYTRLGFEVEARRTLARQLAPL